MLLIIFTDHIRIHTIINNSIFCMWIVNKSAFLFPPIDVFMLIFYPFTSDMHDCTITVSSWDASGHIEMPDIPSIAIVEVFVF